MALCLSGPQGGWPPARNTKLLPRPCFQIPPPFSLPHHNRERTNWIVSGYRKSTLNIDWKDWCWSWSFKTLASWCKELTNWERPWCWEKLRAGGEGNDRGCDEMVGWHHQLNGGESEQTPGHSEGQGSLTFLQSIESLKTQQDWATEQQQNYGCCKWKTIAKMTLGFSFNRVFPRRCNRA